MAVVVRAEAEPTAAAAEGVTVEGDESFNDQFSHIKGLEVNMATIIKKDIPATRDPFVNAQVVPAGVDPETGEDRFWASTWNSNSGCIGALFTSSGKNKLFRFDKSKGQFGFYGASYQGDNIMWLSGFLDNVTKLDLTTGETVSYNTGLTHDLSISGFTYDANTKKAFLCTYCQGDKKRKGFVFDTVSCKTVKIFDDIPLKNNQLRYSVKNNDGTYTLVNMIPGIELIIWNPANDDLDVVADSMPALVHSEYFKVVKSPQGNIYIPSYGWFSPERREFVPLPKAPKEACWFAMKGNVIYGAQWMQSIGGCNLVKWNTDTNDINSFAFVPDTMSYHFALTSNEKIVALNLYGFFYRIDPSTGVLETSQKFESDSVGHVDCLHRIDENRLLGTPFITQRFFEMDIQNNKGFDLGRATGGVGEVLAVIPFQEKIYMASYTKGYLTEYDPQLPARFPENPRPVVEPPEPAMRPVGYCTDQDSIYYSCSHEYGYLGSMSIKYTPGKGQTVFLDNPLENHMIRTMEYNRETNTVIAGTTYEADCRSCPSKDDNSFIVKFDPATLKVIDKVYAPVKTVTVRIVGVMHDGCYLLGLHTENGLQYATIDIKEFIPRLYGQNSKDTSNERCGLYYTGRPGYFVSVGDRVLGLWNSRTGEIERIIHHAKGFYRIHVQDNCIYLIYDTYIEILENCIFF